MSFFKNIFGSGDENKLPSIKFGRYTDANKTKEQLESWDKSVKLFGEKKYLDAYEEFFHYIKDPALNNVSFSRQPEDISFEIIQGSKVIRGKANNNQVVAETHIVEFEKTSIAWMRKLMDLNFALKYSRFAIKDNRVCMKFSTNVMDGSPTKLYWSLRELATRSDKQDDLLSSEFGSLKSVDTIHTEEISAEEKEIKYKYLMLWIKKALEQAAPFDADKFSGAISYIFLSLTYRIDYLLAPEGTLMNDLEKIQNIYFAKDNSNYIQRNQQIKIEFEKILQQPKENVIKGFYKVKSTFAIMTASDFKTVADFVYNESANTNWYRDNKYPEIVACIYEYISSYSLFNYGMQQPLIEFFNLIMQVLNHDFYTELGVNDKLVSNGKPDRSNIEDQIRSIINRGKKTYPNLDFKLDMLKYDSINLFGETFMKEIDYLNFTK
jgi:hypothetical protein